DLGNRRVAKNPAERRIVEAESVIDFAERHQQSGSRRVRGQTQWRKRMPQCAQSRHREQRIAQRPRAQHEHATPSPSGPACHPESPTDSLLRPPQPEVAPSPPCPARSEPASGVHGPAPREANLRVESTGLPCAKRACERSPRLPCAKRACERSPRLPCAK